MADAPGSAAMSSSLAWVQSEHRREAERPAAGAAEDDEPLRLTVEPVRDERGLGGAVVTRGHVQQSVAIPGPQLVGVRVAEALPLPEAGRERVAAVQEHEVGGRRQRRLLRPVQAGDDMLANPGVHGGEVLGVAPLQVRGEDVAREVVRQQPGVGELRERQLAQPAEQLGCILLAEDMTQQPLRGDPGEREHVECRPVARAGHVGREARDELCHHIGRVAEPGGRFRPLREHVDEQRERERMAVREGEHVAVPALRHAGRRQVRAGVVRREVAQRHDA
jgi:hypothetical protein